ncbi:MAG: 50S ribosomal protein L30 [Armatimonadetes bacterium]|nr:50S ribosomal protein L30 [Armatimonadota bacterium]
MATLKITLKKSLIGFEKSQGLTARALGLGKVGSSVTQPDNPAIRGMIQKLNHVLAVENEGGDLISAPAPNVSRKHLHGPQHGPVGKKRK